MTAATTWRDLAGQLTSNQVAHLDLLVENNGLEYSPPDFREWLLNRTRDYIAANVHSTPGGA